MKTLKYLFIFIFILTTMLEANSGKLVYFDKNGQFLKTIVYAFNFHGKEKYKIHMNRLKKDKSIVKVEITGFNNISEAAELKNIIDSHTYLISGKLSNF